MEDHSSDTVAHLKEVLHLLKKVERTYAVDRSETISLLQTKIWDTPELNSEEFSFLQDLAGDFNFYEPFEKDRDTALGYYDDHKLAALTAAAVQRIQTLLTNK